MQKISNTHNKWKLNDTSANEEKQIHQVSRIRVLQISYYNCKYIPVTKRIIIIWLNYRKWNEPWTIQSYNIFFILNVYIWCIQIVIFWSLRFTIYSLFPCFLLFSFIFVWKRIYVFEEQSFVFCGFSVISKIIHKTSALKIIRISIRMVDILLFTYIPCIIHDNSWTWNYMTCSQIW